MIPMAIKGNYYYYSKIKYDLLRFSTEPESAIELK
jgi:hypothetical protein